MKSDGKLTALCYSLLEKRCGMTVCNRSCSGLYSCTFPLCFLSTSGWLNQLGMVSCIEQHWSKHCMTLAAISRADMNAAASSLY